MRMISEEERPALLNRLALRCGLLLCAAFLAVKVVYLMVNPIALFSSYWLGVVQLLAMLAIMVFFCIYIRRRLGNYWSFSEAFKACLTILLLYTVTDVASNAIILGVTHPWLVKEIPAAMAAEVKKIYESTGADKNIMQEQMQQIKESGDALQVNARNITTTLGIRLAMNGLFAIILALIMKRSEQ